MVGFDIHVGSVNPHLSIEVPLNISIDYLQILILENLLDILVMETKRYVHQFNAREARYVRWSVRSRVHFWFFSICVLLTFPNKIMIQSEI